MTALTLDFQALVDEYYQPLYAFARSLAKNDDDAGDLVQQTFLIWAEKGQSLREATKVKSWLFTTLYREFLRLRRKGGHVSALEPEVLESQLPPVSPGIANSIDGNGAVAALEQVDEVYRAPLTLFYLENLSYKEIATTLEIPIGTVMSRLSRGKAQLKSILSDENVK